MKTVAVVCVSMLIFNIFTTSVKAQRQRGRGHTQGSGQPPTRGGNPQPQEPGQITPTGAQPQTPDQHDPGYGDDDQEVSEGDNHNHNHSHDDGPFAGDKNYGHGIDSGEFGGEEEGKPTESGEPKGEHPESLPKGGKNEGNGVDGTDVAPQGNRSGRKGRT